MPRLATDDEANLVRELFRKIAGLAHRNGERSLYADAELLLDRYDVRLPDGKEIEQTPFFWPQKAVSVFASRLVPARFTMADQGLLDDLDGALEASRGVLVQSMAIASALRHGPAFVFTSRGDVASGEPEVIITARSALQATAKVDPRTGLVRSALELTGPRRAYLHLPGVVLDVELTGRHVVVREEIPGPDRVGCAPFVHGPTLERPFGVSRISKPVMGYTRAGMRAFIASEISAAWYAQPRERATGVDAEAFADGAWVQAPGGVQATPDIHPEDDPLVPDALRRAEFRTLPQMTMQPYSDQMRMIGGLFSGAASIPPHYIGIMADSNPQSAQAVWASEIDLVREATAQRPGFNEGRRALALNILSLLHDDFDVRAAAQLTAHWESAGTRSPLEQGQFVAQQVQAGNMQPGTAGTLAELPITPESARVILDENRTAGVGSLLDRILSDEPTQDDSGGVASRDQFEALGVAIRAGVDPDDAARRLGLHGVKFTGAVPVALRMPETQAHQLEDR